MALEQFFPCPRDKLLTAKLLEASGLPPDRKEFHSGIARDLCGHGVAQSLATSNPSRGGGVADRDPEMLTPGSHTTSYHVIFTIRHGPKIPNSTVNLAQDLQTA